MKRLSLELGGNAPVAVLADADVERAAEQVAIAGYANAGQVCISTQRVIVDRKVYADFLDALGPMVSAIRTGDPLEPDTKLSAMISESEAERVGSWVERGGGERRASRGGRRSRRRGARRRPSSPTSTRRCGCSERSSSGRRSR